jgi:hypothetical protein
MQIGRNFSPLKCSSYMDIKTSTKTTLEEATTETITLAPAVEVCRVTVVRKSGDEALTTVTEHVRHTEKPADPNFGDFAIVAPALVEHLRMTGWFRDNKDYELISRTPFTHVTSGKPFELVRIKLYDHSLYTAEGQPLPVAMHFDYIEANTHNRSFDLRKLVEHLQARTDVTLNAPRHPSTRDPFIQPIPYYNAEGGRSEYVEFTWHPDVETFREYLRTRASGATWDRYPAAHKIMGNDAFRIPERDDDDAEGDDD